MVEVPADLVDSASQTPLSRAGSQQTFGRSSPPAPRSRSPPGRPLPRRRATVSAARGGGQARSRGARPTLPATPGPGSPSSDRRRRGSRQRSLPRPPPHRTHAHWSDRAASPAPPNQSPGFPPCS